MPEMRRPALPPEGKDFSIAQAAMYLGLHRSRLYRLRAAGSLPAYWDEGAGEWRITAADLEDFQRQREAESLEFFQRQLERLEHQKQLVRKRRRKQEKVFQQRRSKKGTPHDHE